MQYTIPITTAGKIDISLDILRNISLNIRSIQFHTTQDSFIIELEHYSITFVKGKITQINIKSE